MYTSVGNRVHIVRYRVIGRSYTTRSSRIKFGKEPQHRYLAYTHLHITHALPARDNPVGRLLRQRFVLVHFITSLVRTYYNCVAFGSSRTLHPSRVYEFVAPDRKNNSYIYLRGYGFVCPTTLLEEKHARNTRAINFFRTFKCKR